VFHLKPGAGDRKCLRKKGTAGSSPGYLQPVVCAGALDARAPTQVQTGAPMQAHFPQSATALSEPLTNRASISVSATLRAFSNQVNPGPDVDFVAVAATT